jgi:hypothetical protein
MIAIIGNRLNLQELVNCGEVERRFLLAPTPPVRRNSLQLIPVRLNLASCGGLQIRGHFFYEKVRKVKADVAALLIFDLRHISTKKFALGSLRSDDWQLNRPTVPPVLSVLP